MNVLVGVISYAAAWIMPREYVDRLRRAFPQHTFLEAWDRDEVRRLLPDADVAFTPYIPRDLFPALTRLRWVQVPAAGVDFLLFPEMNESDIVLTSARGIRARAIAEHVMGVTIALARNLQMAVRAQVVHEWAQDALEQRGVRTLHRRRMAIVGLGAIGLEVARLASAFGMTVSGIRRHVNEPKPDGVAAVLPPERLLDLIGDADVVVLSAPLTGGTHRLIGAAEIAVMRRGTLLVNIARGRLLDDEPVIEALRSGHLGGAALDVFAHEPLDPASPYWDLPTVIITPHTSGTLEDYWTPLVALFADNLRRFVAGEPLVNVVDKRAGY